MPVINNSINQVIQWLNACSENKEIYLYKVVAEYHRNIFQEHLHQGKNQKKQPKI